MPAEKNLYIHLLAAKDLVVRKVLNRLCWIDTLDMLSDGMTKGVIDRGPLLKIATTNRWELHGAKPSTYTTGDKQSLKESQPELKCKWVNASSYSLAVAVAILAQDTCHA